MGLVAGSLVGLLEGLLVGLVFSYCAGCLATATLQLVLFSWAAPSCVHMVLRHMVLRHMVLRHMVLMLMVLRHMVLRLRVQWHVFRVGQHRICAPYMTVCMVISLL